MSRQAVVETEVEAKCLDTLKEAVRVACTAVNGVQVDTVRYYAGAVLGIRAGQIEVGVVVGANGKITFVGEDMHLNSEMGKRIQGLVLKNYSSIAFAKTLRKMGFRVTETKGDYGVKNKTVGVRA
jgi:phenylalanyl-tRNA synthetase beta subunit